jgi:hypothetical protein
LAVFKVPQWVAIWSHGPIPRRDDWTPAFPGVVASILAAVFLFHRSPDRERWRIKTRLWILALASFVLSLGPVLKIHAYDPIWSASWIPLPGKIFTLFSAVRWPMRILLLGFLFGAVLGGLGFSQATQRLKPVQRWAAVSLAILLLFAEYRPRASYAADSVALPAPLAVSEAYPFLASEADSGGVIEMPDVDTDGDRVPYLVRYVYGSAGHLRRVVAYHGSVLPALMTNLLGAAESLPNEPARRFLLAWGVTRLVVHREPPFTDSWPLRRDALIAGGYNVIFEGKEATVFALGASQRQLP